MSDVVLDSKSFQSVVNEISTEIFDNNKNVHEVAIVGIQNKGVFLAKKILAEIAELAGIGKSRIPFGTLNIALCRGALDNLGSKMPVV